MLKWFTYLLSVTLPLALGLSTYEYFNPGLITTQNQSYLDTYYLVYEIFTWVMLIPLSLFALLVSAGAKKNTVHLEIKGNKDISKEKVVDALEQIENKMKRPVASFFSMLTLFELAAILLILQDYSFGVAFALTSISILSIKGNLVTVLKRVKASYEEETQKEASSS